MRIATTFAISSSMAAGLVSSSIVTLGFLWISTCMTNLRTGSTYDSLPVAPTIAWSIPTDMIVGCFIADVGEAGFSRGSRLSPRHRPDPRGEGKVRVCRPCAHVREDTSLSTLFPFHVSNKLSTSGCWTKQPNGKYGRRMRVQLGKWPRGRVGGCPSTALAVVPELWHGRCSVTNRNLVGAKGVLVLGGSVVLHDSDRNIHLPQATAVSFPQPMPSPHIGAAGEVQWRGTSETKVRTLVILVVGAGWR